MDLLNTKRTKAIIILNTKNIKILTEEIIKLEEMTRKLRGQISNNKKTEESLIYSLNEVRFSVIEFKNFGGSELSNTEKWLEKGRNLLNDIAKINTILESELSFYFSKLSPLKKKRKILEERNIDLQKNERRNLQIQQMVMNDEIDCIN
jgi:hypothetical protein